jgi:hypothetical protein
MGFGAIPKLCLGSLRRCLRREGVGSCPDSEMAPEVTEIARFGREIERLRLQLRGPDGR